MLIQFSVNNYMSLRDDSILSMVAGQGKELSQNLRQYRDGSILPTVAIFGANAAGKSNVFKAMSAAIHIIRSSNDRQIDKPIPFINPYAFDDEHKSKPSTFDFIFEINGEKYQYGFSADKFSIYDEYLYAFKTKIPSLIFERTNTSNYKFTYVNEGKLKKYIDKTSSNKLFLSTATNWNCDLTKNAYMWFANYIDTYNDSSFKLNPFTLDTFDKQGDLLRDFVTSLLKTADINISGYNVESEIVDVPAFPMEDIPIGIHIDAPQKMKSIKLSANHIISNDNGVNEFSLPLDVESEGTKRIFAFGPIIKKALEQGRAIIVDEIDNSLHPLLLEYLISLFNSKESNPNNAQLIFNTHSVETLSQDLFRRDQVYFVEKDNENGVTEIYALDEFSPRINENIRKGYLQGRYGAVPNIGWEDLVW